MDAIKMAAAQWSMTPWLPGGFLLLPLMALAIIASFWWTNRPSGLSGSRKSGAFRRLLPLLVLVWPLLIFVGFFHLLMPIAHPETLVLRSRSASLSADRLSGASCFTDIADALNSSSKKPPLCLDDALPKGTDGRADSELQLAKLELAVKKSFMRTPDRRDILLGSNDLDQIIESSLDTEGISSQTIRFRLSRALKFGRNWWASVQGTQLVDAGPVVDRAVELFNPIEFAEQDYIRADPALIHALSSAALQAVREKQIGTTGNVSCVENSSGNCSPSQSYVPPAAIEALEVAVIRLLVSQRNIRGVLVETHGRLEPIENNRWARLRLVLLEGQYAGSGQGVGLVTIAGSAKSASELIDVVREPWLRRVSTGGVVYAQLRFGAEPSGDISFVLKDAKGGTIPTSCDTLEDCFAGKALEAGDSVLLRLEYSGTGRSVSSFEVKFPSNPEIRSISEDVFINTGSEFVSIDVLPADILSNQLEHTLLCLMENPAGADPSVTRTNFSNLLNFGDGPRIKKQPNGALISVVDIPNKLSGIWIHSSEVSIDKVLAEVKPFFSIHRSISIDDEIVTGGKLYGAGLFPIAISREIPVKQLLPVWYTPLKPKRTTALNPAVDPALNLVLPRSVQINTPFAKPVVFSAIADTKQQAPLDIHPKTVAPLGWKIKFPKNVTSIGGGVVWYFDLDIKSQGLLLGADCTPAEKPFGGVLSSNAVRGYEPTYEEARFIPLWLKLLSSAREVAFNAPNTITNKRETQAPDFLESWMVARSRIVTAFPGLLLITIGILGYAVFLLLQRLRQRQLD